MLAVTSTASTALPTLKLHVPRQFLMTAVDHHTQTLIALPWTPLLASVGKLSLLAKRIALDLNLGT